MVDERRARIRRNMARAWAYAAAAAAREARISWDLYGNTIGLAGGLMSATLSTPPASGPTLIEIATDLSDGVTANQHVFSASIGTASANRRVFFVGNIFNQTNRIVAASIGGSVATIHYAGGETFYSAPVIFSALVPSGAIASFTVSYSGGTAPTPTLYGRVYHADNSLFLNGAPSIATAAGQSPIVSITSSANAVLLFAGVMKTDASIEFTLSPASNIATLNIRAPTQWQRYGYANSVSAQVSVISGQCVTVSQSAEIAVLVWR